MTIDPIAALLALCGVWALLFLGMVLVAITERPIPTEPTADRSRGVLPVDAYRD